MKLIPIYNRYKELLFNAKLDDDDYERLSIYKWHAVTIPKSKDLCIYYARRMETINGKECYFYMHREIIGIYESNIIVDHINRDTTDNRKCNLRIATRSQNKANSISQGKSRYKGVIAYHTKNGRQNSNIYYYWGTCIRINGKTKWVGYFPFTEEGEILAAKRYNEYAKIEYGEFANLNTFGDNKEPKTFKKIERKKYEGKDKILVSQKVYVLIDEEDHEMLSKYSWCAEKQLTGGYYIIHRLKTGKRIYMHRLLTNCPEGMVVDHIDGNKFNNKKSNLRICTTKQNSQNRRSDKTSNSKYLGVCKAKKTDKRYGKIYYYYQTSIKANGKNMNVFHTKATACGELLAAIKYDEVAEKYFGEYANLNFKSLW